MTDTSQKFLIESVFLPTDFSPASETAFYHALKTAVVAKARLNVLHVTDEDNQVDWTSFPPVRETLVRWGLFPEGGAKHDIEKLGLGVSKVVMKSGNVVKASLSFLEENPADLIVIATRHDEGRARWFSGSVGEPIARKAQEMTLFLPNNCRGFVSPEDGSVSIRNILVPVDEKPNAMPSLLATQKMINVLGLPPGRVELLHIGGKPPSVPIPKQNSWQWDYERADGNVVSTILERAAASRADIIVMTTAGPDGFLDGLRGTTTERVLAQAQCPLLVIPVEAAYL